MIKVIIGGIIGLLCGGILFAFVTFKDFDKAWDEAYNLGFRHGEEMEKIRQAHTYYCSQCERKIK